MSGDFQLVSPSENMQVSKDFVDKTGDAICAVCLDTQIINGTCVAECYSIEKRQLYRIKVPDGRARKTWKLRFSVARTDENGISDVENFDVLGDSPLKSTTVELDKHGVVRIKTYVAISYCPHHESYEGKVLWSEEFGRVLAGERDRVERLQVYSTWVERDKSDEAKRYGVDFRICDLLKPVTDETVVKRCRQRMMDDQEALHEKSVSTRKLSPAPPHEDMGQSTFSLNANVFAFREGKPRGNGLYVGSQLPKRLHGHERKEKISEFKKKESDNSLLLFTRKKQKFSEAWCRNLGRVIMLDIVFEGSELKEGDWFYASIRLFPELFRDVEPIYVVKKVIDLADPLAYADCFMNEIQLEIECKGKHVGSDENGRIIFEHPAIGNIVMTPEEYNVVRSRRMVCHVQFNHDNPYHKPWSLVNLVRELQEHEELPNRAEPDSRVGSHGHHGQRGYETDDERFTGRDHLNANHRHGKPSSDPSHNRRHHCPQLEEALDIIGRLLDSYEISRAIDRRSPWLLPRMRRLVSSCGEGGRRSDRESHYGSDTSSYAVSDEESRRRPRGHDY